MSKIPGITELARQDGGCQSFQSDVFQRPASLSELVLAWHLLNLPGRLYDSLPKPSDGRLVQGKLNHQERAYA